jgi:hypothetical protein
VSIPDSESIRQSDIHRMIDDWKDAHPEPGPDEDSLRAYFAGALHQDWRDRMDPTVRRCLAVMAGAVLVLAVVWLVTA